MPTPNAYDVISTQLPKWWKSLRNKDDFTVADAVDLVAPHDLSDAALMAMGGGLGKVANTALGALAASSYSPEAEGGALNPKLGALAKLERMLRKARPPQAPKPLPGFKETGKNSWGIMTPTGEASIIAEPRYGVLNKVIQEEYPGAIPFTLDTSMLQGNGRDFYRSLYASLGRGNNLVQQGGALSQVNRGRKGMAIADAYTMDNMPHNRVEYAESLNLADSTDAPFMRALLPADTPLGISSSDFARLGVDDQVALLRVNQMLGVEDAIKKNVPEYWEQLMNTDELLPRNIGALSHNRMDADLLKKAEYKLADLKSMDDKGIYDRLTPQIMAKDAKAELLPSAYGQASMDYAKLLMDSLVLPEKYHPQLLDDYLKHLSEVAGH